MALAVLTFGFVEAAVPNRFSAALKSELFMGHPLPALLAAKACCRNGYCPMRWVVVVVVVVVVCISGSLMVTFIPMPIPFMFTLAETDSPVVVVVVVVSTVPLLMRTCEGMP